MTVAVTITASSIILPAGVVFKGEQNRQIAKDKFKTYLKDHFYACQKNAWMDEPVMKQWVDVVLKLYVETAPNPIIPLLILDSYHCHMISSVVHYIQELGVEVQTFLVAAPLYVSQSMLVSTSHSKHEPITYGNHG